MTDVLDRLKSITNASYPTEVTDAFLKEVAADAIKEIESLREQFLQGVSQILSTAKETNLMVKDANERLDKAGL